MSTHVVELTSAELEGLQQALDILLKGTIYHGQLIGNTSTGTV